MRVILCDNCKKVIEPGDRIIYGDLSRFELLDSLDLNIQGITTQVLIGKHFCSVKCVRESIPNESN